MPASLQGKTHVGYLYTWCAGRNLKASLQEAYVHQKAKLWGANSPHKCIRSLYTFRGEVLTRLHTRQDNFSKEGGACAQASMRFASDSRNGLKAAAGTEPYGRMFDGGLTRSRRSDPTILPCVIRCRVFPSLAGQSIYMVGE